MVEEDKITKFESFLNDTLKADLKKLMEQRQTVFDEIADHLQLRNALQALQKTGADQQPLKTKVDLGCNFYCSARVDDPSRVCVLVGFGFFVEMTYSEALEYIERRVPLLEVRAEQLGRDAVSVKAKIDLVLEGLRELQGLTDAQEPRPVDRL